MMQLQPVNASNAPAASGGYAQAFRISGADEFLFVSGQVPVDCRGKVPKAFADQCRLVWRNIEAQLRAADMDLGHIVKVTTFLSDRDFAAENSQIRQEILAGLSPALTVIITGIYDPEWMLEIEVVAARGAA